MDVSPELDGHRSEKRAKRVFPVESVARSEAGLEIRRGRAARRVDLTDG